MRRSYRSFTSNLPVPQANEGPPAYYRGNTRRLCRMRIRNSAACFIGATMIATGAFAQVTPAAGYTPPDDTPKISVGATIFGDYTYVESPKTKDADGNAINASSINITRAYINVTGNL